MIVEKACWERGCACYDARFDEGVKVALEQREWQGLTDEEIKTVYDNAKTTDTYVFIRAIEAKLKEKNT